MTDASWGYTATQAMEAIIGGDNVDKINKREGAMSPSEMREYLLKEPPIGFIEAEKLYLEEKEIEEHNEDDEYDFENGEQKADINSNPFDLYGEYARQFGGVILRLIEEDPNLDGPYTNWWQIATSKGLTNDQFADWLTGLNAGWAINAARYALKESEHFKFEEEIRQIYTNGEHFQNEIRKKITESEFIRRTKEMDNSDTVCIHREKDGKYGVESAFDYYYAKTRGKNIVFMDDVIKGKLT